MNRSLDLEEYGDLISLRVPFAAIPSSRSLSAVEYADRVRRVAQHFFREYQQQQQQHGHAHAHSHDHDDNEGEEETEGTVDFSDVPLPRVRSTLRQLLTIRSPRSAEIPPHVLDDVNSVLQFESLTRGTGITDAMKELPRLSQLLSGDVRLDAHGKALYMSDQSVATAAASPIPLDRLAVWRGDITKMRVDCIVNAANTALLGCFQPSHLCIDNVIHAAAGPQLRQDCFTIMNRQVWYRCGVVSMNGHILLIVAYVMITSSYD